MAEIRNYALARHLRSEQTSHIIRYSGGKIKRSGRGISFWILGVSTSVAEVPMEDQELSFLFHGRSVDFQDVTLQGVIGYRVVDAQLAAKRIDFSLDLRTGEHQKQPLESISVVLTELAQQFASSFVYRTPIRDLLSSGHIAVRKDILNGFESEQSILAFGIEIVSVRVSAIKPNADVEKALETKTREKIQQEADEARFERRALAVEKERAIAENELKNQIELANRQEELIAQEGKNQQHRNTEAAHASKIMAESQAERLQIESRAKAAGMRLVDAAKNEAELQRIAIYRELPTSVMMGLATKELASKLKKIDHISISPDMFGPAFVNLLEMGAKHLGTTKS